MEKKPPYTFDDSIALLRATIPNGTKEENEVASKSLEGLMRSKEEYEKQLLRARKKGRTEELDEKDRAFRFTFRLAMHVVDATRKIAHNLMEEQDELEKVGPGGELGKRIARLQKLKGMLTPKLLDWVGAAKTVGSLVVTALTALGLHELFTQFVGPHATKITTFLWSSLVSGFLGLRYLYLPSRLRKLEGVASHEIGLKREAVSALHCETRKKELATTVLHLLKLFEDYPHAHVAAMDSLLKTAGHDPRTRAAAIRWLCEKLPDPLLSEALGGHFSPDELFSGSEMRSDQAKGLLAEAVEMNVRLEFPESLLPHQAFWRREKEYREQLARMTAG